MNLLRRQTSITGLFNKIVSVDAPALDVPDIDSFVGLMHTLFALEDMYGLGLYKGEDDLPVLSLHPSESSNPVAAREFSAYLDAWLDQAEKFRNGEITREEYDKCRYEFPKHDTSRYRQVLCANSFTILAELSLHRAGNLPLITQ